MERPKPTWNTWLLGRHERVRLRVSQTLLATLPLWLIDALLFVQWQRGALDGRWLLAFVAVSSAGALVFFAVVRADAGRRLSREASLSAPQMVFAMLCTAVAYALAGPPRAALLCLMPLVLCFGIFALQPSAARALARLGIAVLGLEMAALAWLWPQQYAPLDEAVHWAFAATAMAMTGTLADRLGRLRARLHTQKAELAAALEQIRQLATHDVLTGLLNRRAGQDELQRAAAQCERQRQPLAIALADLDHFKQINDSLGHAAGDRVLVTFAEAAQRELRAADRVARWGGEEFLFVLPGADEDDAVQCLNRVRRAFAAAAGDGLPTAPGFSAGVATCHGAHDICAALERADRALYQAKAAGRGRTHTPAAPLAA